MSDLVRLYYKKKITDEIDSLTEKRDALKEVMKKKNQKYITMDGMETIFNKVIKDLESIVQK